MKNIVEFPDRSVIEDEASRWIIKFEGDQSPDSRDIEELKAWMSRSPTHRKILIQLASNWNDMDLLSGLVVPQGKIQKAKESRIKKLIFWLLTPVMLLATSLGSLGRFVNMPSQRVAGASVLSLLVVGLTVWLFFYQQQLSDNLYLTSIGEQSSHVLTDGTFLRLNTNSRAEVDFKTNKRIIILHKGEAHFDVFPAPLRPFEVYAGTRIVRAIGTAFSVYLNHNDVRITVTEGKVELAPISIGVRNREHARSVTNGNVSVTADTGDISGSLEAGQSVVIPADHKGAIDDIINDEPRESARRLSWVEGKLVFAGESLEEVVAEVSRYTAVTIEVVDPELKSMRIGGQFQVGEIDALFDVLESSFGIKISRLSEQHVQIHAKK